jgi:hypothetical protein
VGFGFCLGVFLFCVLFSVSCKEGSLSTPDRAGILRDGTGEEGKGCMGKRNGGTWQALGRLLIFAELE